VCLRPARAARVSSGKNSTANSRGSSTVATLAAPTSNVPSPRLFT